MKFSASDVEVLNPGWLFQNPLSLYNCKMQASNLKSMFVVNGHPIYGVIRLDSSSDLLSTLTCQTDTLDDVGLTLRIDDKLRESCASVQENALAELSPLTPPADINLHIPGNYDTCQAASGKSFSRSKKDLFEAFLQPAPPTPVQSPSSYGKEHCKSPNCLCKNSWLERQTSLSIALEVLGEPPILVVDERFPPTPPSENQDEPYLQYPSPSYVENSASLPRESSRIRTVSDPSEYRFVSSATVVDESSRLRVFSDDHSSNALNFQFSPTSHVVDADSDTGSSSGKENQSDTSSSTASLPTTTATNSDCAESATPGLTSLPSFLKACNDTAPSDGDIEESLDMDGMLQDFLEDSDKLEKKRAEHAAKIRRAIATDHCYSAQQHSTVSKESCTTSTEKQTSPENTTTTNPTTPVEIVVDLTKEEPCTSSSSNSTPKLGKSPSYIRKRDQNNRACRESRRKRKAERDGAENKQKFLVQDNEDMRKKIQELEAEVKQTRALLISRMVNQ